MATGVGGQCLANSSPCAANLAEFGKVWSEARRSARNPRQVCPVSPPSDRANDATSTNVAPKAASGRLAPLLLGFPIQRCRRMSQHASPPRRPPAARRTHGRERPERHHRWPGRGTVKESIKYLMPWDSYGACGAISANRGKGCVDSSTSHSNRAPQHSDRISGCVNWVAQILWLSAQNEAASQPSKEGPPYCVGIRRTPLGRPSRGDAFEETAWVFGSS